MTKGAKHRVTVRTPTGTITRRPDGVATPDYDDWLVPNARVASPSSRDQETAGDSAGYTQVDVVVRLPHTVTITEDSLVVVADTGISGYDGTYSVVGIRPNELDQRVSLVARST